VLCCVLCYFGGHFVRLQFGAWFSEASAKGLVPREGVAMTLATSTPDGFPSARVRSGWLCVWLCV
jgi:hypothetical protein